MCHRSGVLRDFWCRRRTMAVRGTGRADYDPSASHTSARLATIISLASLLRVSSSGFKIVLLRMLLSKCWHACQVQRNIFPRPSFLCFPGPLRTTSRWRTTRSTTAWVWKCTTTRAHIRLAVLFCGPVLGMLGLTKSRPRRRLRKTRRRGYCLYIGVLVVDGEHRACALFLMEKTRELICR